MRFARGSLRNTVRVGTQLKSMPARVTTVGSDDSAFSVEMFEIGVNDPESTSPSTPSATWTWTTLPSARAARNTARPLVDGSGDFVTSAVASAAAVIPCVDVELWFVRLPENTPPATVSGAPLSGAPLGSITVIVPSPMLPFGALANHGRPNPLLSEIPSGRLTAGIPAVTAPMLPLTLFKNAGFCALYTMSAHVMGELGTAGFVGWQKVPACPPDDAKSEGTTIGPPLTSIDRIDPSGWPRIASGAPKFDVLATKIRVRSRIPPESVV